MWLHGFVVNLNFLLLSIKWQLWNWGSAKLEITHKISLCYSCFWNLIRFNFHVFTPVSANACYNIPIKEKSTTLAEEFIHKGNADSSGTLGQHSVLYCPLCSYTISLFVSESWYFLDRTTDAASCSLWIYFSVRTPCRIDGNAGITDRALCATRDSFPRIIGGMSPG